MRKQRAKIFILIAIVLILALLFMGCIPNSFDNAKKKMIRLGYEVTEEDIYPEADKNGAMGIIQFAKKDNVAEGCLACLYNTEANAKAMLESTLDTIHLGGDIYRVKYGSWIIVGSTRALKDFKSMF